MLYLLIAILAVAVVGLTIGLVYISRNQRDASSEDLERRMTELMATQQALVGKVDAVSQQQVVSSKALTDTLTTSQQRLSKQLYERLEVVQTSIA